MAAATLREIKHVILRDVSSVPMDRVSPRDMEEAARSTTDGDVTGEPVIYASYGTFYRFYPTPDQAYPAKMLVRQQAGVAELTTSNSTFLPLGWAARLMIPYIAYRLLMEDGTRDALSLADRYKVQYDEAFVLFRNAWAYPDDEIALRSPGFTSDLDSPAESWWAYDE